MIDLGLVAEVVSIVFVILSAVLGIKFKGAIRKLHAIRELIDDLDKALEDMRITKTELKKIVADLRKVMEDP